MEPTYEPVEEAQGIPVDFESHSAPSWRPTVQPASVVMPSSIVTQAVEAAKHAETLKHDAIDQLLKQQDEILENLKILGYPEPQAHIGKEQVEPPKRPVAAANGKAAPVSEPQAHVVKPKAEKGSWCKLCSMAGHNVRHHKGQGKKLKAFTNKELKAKGFLAKG